MYNYNDYEANLPKDKASYKVLYNDYFHDSLITEIHISPKMHSLEIHIQCQRECEAESHNLPKDILNEKYGYILTFLGVSFLEVNTSLQGCEYINGRFKAIPKGKYYFRMQTADGYIDIGYRRFQLRKQIGRVSYIGITEFDPWMNRSQAVSEDQIAAILKKLADNQYTEEQEFDLFLDLQRLYTAKMTGIASYLRRIVASGWDSEDAVPYAAWLLGKFGSPCDIPLLRQLQGHADSPMIKKNLFDAMDALDTGRLSIRE